MRKTFFVAALLMATMAVKAQKTISFRLKFLPNHTYTVVGNTDMDSRVSSAGQPAKGAKGNQPRSLQNKGNFAMTYVIKTGAAGVGGAIPYTLTVTNFTSKNIINGVEQKAPRNPVIGAVSRGQFTADGKFHTDSFTLPNADEKTQKMISNMVMKFGDEIKFPNKPMRIGESFTQEKPFSVANGNNHIGIKTIVTYTLRSVKGNLAYFDTKELMTMNMDQKGDSKAKVNTSGTGKGTMVYDITNCFAIAKADNFTTKMNMQMGPTAMNVSANSIITYKAKISAN